MLRALYWEMFEATPEAILNIASTTWNLQKFEVTTVGLIEDGNIFKSLVNSNQNLKDIGMMEIGDDDEERKTGDALKILGELLETFSKCTKLSFYFATTDGQEVDKGAVGEICGMLPCREVSAMILIGDEFKYEQTGKLE